MNIKTEIKENISDSDDIFESEIYDKIKNKNILKQNWDQDSRSFKWENVEHLITQPRIVSQARTVCYLHMLIFLFIFTDYSSIFLLFSHFII